ncbi:unnamed protein product [Amoebophrya sp. A120]|nr:unnamed protein product [Amoebophrya sp. A120]|eukprot:GSA120T00004679001.1
MGGSCSSASSSCCPCLCGDGSEDDDFLALNYKNRGVLRGNKVEPVTEIDQDSVMLLIPNPGEFGEEEEEDEDADGTTSSLEEEAGLKTEVDGGEQGTATAAAAVVVDQEIERRLGEKMKERLLRFATAARAALMENETNEKKAKGRLGENKRKKKKRYIDDAFDYNPRTTVEDGASDFTEEVEAAGHHEDDTGDRAHEVVDMIPSPGTPAGLHQNKSAKKISTNSRTTTTASVASRSSVNRDSQLHDPLLEEHAVDVPGRASSNYSTTWRSSRLGAPQHHPQAVVGGGGSGNQQHQPGIGKTPLVPHLVPVHASTREKLLRDIPEEATSLQAESEQDAGDEDFYHYHNLVSSSEQPGSPGDHGGPTSASEEFKFNSELSSTQQLLPLKIFELVSAGAEPDEQVVSEEEDTRQASTGDSTEVLAEGQEPARKIVVPESSQQRVGAGNGVGASSTTTSTTTTAVAAPAASANYADANAPSAGAGPPPGGGKQVDKQKQNLDFFFKNESTKLLHDSQMMNSRLGGEGTGNGGRIVTVATASTVATSSGAEAGTNNTTTSNTNSSSNSLLQTALLAASSPEDEASLSPAQSSTSPAGGLFNEETTSAAAGPSGSSNSAFVHLSGTATKEIVALEIPPLEVDGEDTQFNAGAQVLVGGTNSSKNSTDHHVVTLRNGTTGTSNPEEGSTFSRSTAQVSVSSTISQVTATNTTVVTGGGQPGRQEFPDEVTTGQRQPVSNMFTRDRLLKSDTSNSTNATSDYHDQSAQLRSWGAGQPPPLQPAIGSKAPPVALSSSPMNSATTSKSNKRLNLKRSNKNRPPSQTEQVDENQEQMQIPPTSSESQSDKKKNLNLLYYPEEEFSYPASSQESCSGGGGFCSTSSCSSSSSSPSIGSARSAKTDESSLLQKIHERSFEPNLNSFFDTEIENGVWGNRGGSGEVLEQGLSRISTTHGATSRDGRASSLRPPGIGSAMLGKVPSATTRVHPPLVTSIFGDKIDTFSDEEGRRRHEKQDFEDDPVEDDEMVSLYSPLSSADEGTMKNITTMLNQDDVGPQRRGRDNYNRPHEDQQVVVDHPDDQNAAAFTPCSADFFSPQRYIVVVSSRSVSEDEEEEE